MKDPLILPNQYGSSSIDKGIDLSPTIGRISMNADVIKHQVGRLYANNAPKILLETISARTTTILIIVTYVVFIIGFIKDIDTTLVGFTADGHNIGINCTNSDYQMSSSAYALYPGCAVNNHWNGSVFDLSNVISIELTVGNYNISQELIQSLPPSIKIDYSLDVWACYDAKGCGNRFTTNSESNSASVWHSVLSQYSHSINIDTSSNNAFHNVTLLENTFQNQESLPTKGVVKSYFLEVTYSDSNLYNVFSPDTNYTGFINDIVYSLDVSQRDYSVYDVNLSIFLLVITCVCLAGYLMVMYRHKKKWLPEQRWLVIYLVALIFYQNPIYCNISASSSNVENASSAFASYVFDAIGQCTLFFIWLTYAASIFKKTTNKWAFYSMKTVLCLFIFICNLVMISYQFPSVTKTRDRDPVEAVSEWSKTEKNSFIFFSVSFVVLQWVWTFYWCVLLYRSARKLKELPYMNTRYIQLSYRFFLIQATLVMSFYILQYSCVIYLLNYKMSAGHSATSLADNINTLVRQQTQLSGRLLFLTVYTLILTFLYLPVSAFADRIDIFAITFSSTYVITEEELEEMTRIRKLQLQRRPELINSITNTKYSVYCIEIALEMCNICYESYYDLRDFPLTASSYTKEASATDPLPITKYFDVKQYDYEVIERIYEESTETFCTIVKHTKSGRIVVAFRGSTCQKHWESNLNYSKKYVDFHALDLRELDAEDDLDPENCVRTERVLSSESSNASMSGFNAVKGTIKEGVRQFDRGVSFVTKKIVDTTSGILYTAASNTPVLAQMVKVRVHAGHYCAYDVIRKQMHLCLRKLLESAPSCHVYFTGHSLGGSLATLACMDFALNSLPRITQYLQIKYANIPTNETQVALYTYGGPKVGNTSFVTAFNRVVPNAFRTVVNGDIVAGMPPSGYAHVGTEIIIDGNCSGSIIVDPSFVERQFKSKRKVGISVHSLVVYRNSLASIRQASNFVKDYYTKKIENNSEFDIDSIDETRVALEAGLNLQNFVYSASNSAFNSESGEVVRIEEQSMGVNRIEESVHQVNDLLNIEKYQSKLP